MIHCCIADQLPPSLAKNKEEGEKPCWENSDEFEVDGKFAVGYVKTMLDIVRSGNTYQKRRVILALTKEFRRCQELYKVLAKKFKSSRRNNTQTHLRIPIHFEFFMDPLKPDFLSTEAWNDKDLGEKGMFEGDGDP